MTGLCRQAISRDQTRCRLSPRIGAGNAGIARAHPPIRGCELELVRADEFQLLAGAAHSRTGGVGAPFFFRNDKRQLARHAAA